MYGRYKKTRYKQQGRHKLHETRNKEDTRRQETRYKEDTRYKKHATRKIQGTGNKLQGRYKRTRNKLPGRSREQDFLLHPCFKARVREAVK
jgi:hypothetical protein